MEKISKEQFERAKAQIPEKEEEKDESLTDAQFEEMLHKMDNPVDSLKETAVKVKNFLDMRMKKEMDKNGILSDHTRRWVETFEKILEKIQKALHGDKSVNLHVHKVSHGDIGAKMREAKLVVFGEEKEKKEKKEEK